MIYWQLFAGFLRVGCFAFGGAYGAIPLIRDVVMSHGWMSEETLTYMIAVSESTPGPIMVNMATYVGSDQGGLVGAVLATFAVVLPAFLVILLILIFLGEMLKNPYVSAAMAAIKPCVAGIILATGISMIGKNLVTLEWQSLLLTAVLAVVMFGSGSVLKKKISPIGLILIAAVLGVFLY